MGKSVPRVLVIEDDADVAEITRYLVNQFSGGRTEWVQDSYAALDALCENRYDYVIVDQNLPGLKGLELLSAMDNALDRDPVLSDRIVMDRPISVIFMSGAKVEVPAGFKLKHFVIQDFVAKSSLSRGLARNLAS